MKLSVFTPKVCWDWEKGAYVRERNVIGVYPTTTYVDPTPAYMHDKGLVKELLAEVAEAFPIGWPVTVNILPHETTSRTNGWASHKDEWKRGGGVHRREGAITLAGKRIPPHPAMTRYLVAHEYGHIVDYWISHERGFKDGGNELRKEYQALRAIKKLAYYGPGEWHNSPAELLANDFRIVMAERETEFWPHPGYPHPWNMPAVLDWWVNAKKEYAA